MFKLEVRTGGAAFKDIETGEDDLFQEALEIKRIFGNIIGEIECGHTSGSVMDLNGNRVGSWSR